MQVQNNAYESPLKLRISLEREKLAYKHMKTTRLENRTGVVKIHDFDHSKTHFETMYGLSRTHSCSERILRLSKPREIVHKRRISIVSPLMNKTEKLLPKINIFRRNDNNEIFRISEELDKFTERIKNNHRLFGCSTIDIMNLKAKKYNNLKVN